LRRPILIATIGYIIGIIVGLYFNKSIVLIYIPIIAIFMLNKFYKKKQIEKLKIFSVKRYLRYTKIYLNSNVILVLIISSIISNTILNLQNQKYNKIYNNLENQENINLIGNIISNKEENQYYNKYKIETNFRNEKIRLYITTSKNIQLEYGNEISFSGIYKKPEVQRNYKGFDYSQYLKQLKIYGTIQCENVEILNNNKANKIFKLANNISNKIISNTKKVLKEESSSILLGLMLGNKNDIKEEVQENFTNASMSHILAVSGMHVSYIVLGISLIGKRIIGKRNTEILSIVVLIFYMFITNFTPSITRAGIMGILMILSKLIYRKNDIYTSISISLLLILIYNPFLIQNLGLQLSYGGVLGIVLLNKSVEKMLKKINIKNKFYKYKIRPKIHKQLDKTIEIISISISVQLFILPIILYNLNTFNLYFLISNLILSIFIGPIVIIGFIFIITVLINIQIAQFFSRIIEISISILIFISKIGKIPFSKIYMATPSLFSIVIYYLFLVVIFFVFYIYSSKKPNKTQIRIKNLIALGKIKIKKDKKKLIRIFTIVILIILVINFWPKNLKIYFIDIGQGDSSLIVTPSNKTILIDGGGSINSDFDVGESTLLPYILDRGFTKIDIVIISHFDSDHVGGILTILEELKVNTVYISKQIENSNNYRDFIEIVKKKNIKVHEVIAGNRIRIENNLYFDVLWPKNKQITTNILNNNAIVCNLHYKKFSMLFTGDIEAIAEEEILCLYSANSNLLKADIFKVGHHGSKTSSIQEFLEAVSPRVAVIGVGKNNNFGHPNEGVIERLERLNCEIFRTDLNGEIFIDVDRKGRYEIITKLKSN